MKALIITPNKKEGGVEVANSYLETILLRNGFFVNYLTLENSEYNKSNYLSKITSRILGKPYFTASEFNRIKQKYRLVISNGEFGWGIRHHRAINIFHGSYFGYYNNLKFSYSFKNRLFVRKMIAMQKKAAKGKFVVAVSNYLKKILEKQGIKTDIVIENPVDNNLFKPKKAEKTSTFLFVGRYDYFGKGFDILEKLSVKYKIFCVSNKRPENQLFWIPFVKHSEMPNIYNEFRILVLPSRFEACGLVLLEAMACGLPVITSNVGIGLDLLNKIPEFVIDEINDFERLFEERSKIILNNYSYYSKVAREYVVKYHGFDRYAKAWKNVLEELF